MKCRAKRVHAPRLCPLFTRVLHARLVHPPRSVVHALRPARRASLAWVAKGGVLARSSARGRRGRQHGAHTVRLQGVLLYQRPLHASHAVSKLLTYLPCKFVSRSPRGTCPIHVGRHPGRLRAAPVLWQPRSAGSACTQCRALASAAFAPAPSQVTQEELEREVRRFGPTSNVWVARNPAGFAFVVRPLAPSACLVLPAHR